MVRFIGVMMLAFLAGCTDGIQSSPRDAVRVGETSDGNVLYRFQLTNSNALGVTPVSNRAIAERATEICPGGYEELGRSGEATRRISGVIYTDVIVTILCRARS